MANTESCMVGGRFALDAVLGAGPFASLYTATDGTTGRSVVVKVSKEATWPGGRRRTRQEGQLLAGLCHPRLASLLAAGPVDEDGWFLALDVQSVTTLADRMAEGLLPIADVVAITRQVLEALDELHRLGIVHGAIDAAHLFLQPGPWVVLGEFAHAHGPEHQSGGGRAIGLSASRDLWALGMLVSELISAQRRPNTPDTGPQLRSDVPLWLFHLGLDLLRSRHVRHPRTADSFYRQLVGALEVFSVAPAPLPPAPGP